MCGKSFWICKYCHIKNFFIVSTFEIEKNQSLLLINFDYPWWFLGWGRGKTWNKFFISNLWHKNQNRLFVVNIFLHVEGFIKSCKFLRGVKEIDLRGSHKVRCDSLAGRIRGNSNLHRFLFWFLLIHCLFFYCLWLLNVTNREQSVFLFWWKLVSLE